ncbi:hypothetical protein VTO42DRAFT_1145 [Malbranchea cinnamomea]
MELGNVILAKAADGHPEDQTIHGEDAMICVAIGTQKVKMEMENLMPWPYIWKVKTQIISRSQVTYGWRLEEPERHEASCNVANKRQVANITIKGSKSKPKQYVNHDLTIISSERLPDTMYDTQIFANTNARNHREIVASFHRAREKTFLVKEKIEDPS